MHLRYLVSAHVLAVLITVVASAEDWPQFRGIHRDGKSPETGLLKQWPGEGPKLLWTVTGIGKGFSSVSLANGMLYTTGMVGDKTDGVLTAIDITGKMQWQVHYGPEWGQMHPGTRSTPTVDGDRLYELSGMGLLLCLDARTGAVHWSRNLPKEFAGEAPQCGFAEALLIYGDTVICTPGGKDAALVALDKRTGKTIWTTTGFSDQSAYCSPIRIDRGGHRLVVTITARHVAAVDADSGHLVWSQPFDTDAQDPNHSVAPVYEDGLLYVTSGHREGGQMFDLAPDGSSVTLRWADATLNTLLGGIIFHDGCVYGSNSRNKWVCLDARTGNVLYETTGVGMGSVAYAADMLYCCSDRGTLGLVPATSEAHDVVSRFKMTQGEGPHWAHPVIAHATLYIRHGDFLMAYSLADKQATGP